MQERLLKLTGITCMSLLTLGSFQTAGVAHQLMAQANSDTNVSNVLEETDSDSASQLMAPGNPSEGLSVSIEDLPMISPPERRREEVIEVLSVEQGVFEEKNRSLTIIDIE
ncbi:MAG: hypothetical protein QNJ46_02470 [Leptolyngbyaceae cyanobacterium MO_188.B28]|nr:hypothetical protein [Leptolyngbyaceae cyanobacterium MO_188.B28]